MSARPLSSTATPSSNRPDLRSWPPSSIKAGGNGGRRAVVRRNWSNASSPRPVAASAAASKVSIAGSSLRRAARCKGSSASAGRFCIMSALPRTCAATTLLRFDFNTSEAKRSASSRRCMRNASIAWSSAGLVGLGRCRFEGGRFDMVLDN